MAKEINLLPKKNIGLFQQEQTVTIARAVAILSVLIVVSSLIGLFILGKSYSVADIEAKQASVRSQLQGVQNKINNQLILIDRLNHVQQIISKRTPLESKITILQKQLPTDISIDTLSVTPQQVIISVSSSSLPSLKSFLDSISSMVTKKNLLSKITINNVIVDTKTGNYTVNVVGVFL